MVNNGATNGSVGGGGGVRQLLSSSVGISPSEEWLTACRLHLRERGPGGGDGANDGAKDDADAVLHQILHSDLRDVVESRHRSSGNEGGGGGVGPRPRRPSDLRSAVSRSIGGLRADAAAGAGATGGPSNGGTAPGPARSANSNRIVLPPAFSCLVQVEELLDVSRNAEDRLKHGPAAASSPTPTGDQSRRCLKLALTDRYDNGDGGHDDEDGGREHEEGAAASEMIIGMEVSPLRNLSVHSQPGVKVLLRGPLTVRCGVVMLHGGNATVLGGCVPSLIPIQRRAMEMAARVAGVGVDPTVRALVWNPEGADDEEEEKDEGEGESRDVEFARAAPRQPPPAAAAQHPPAAPAPAVVSLSAVASPPEEGGVAEGPAVQVMAAAAPTGPTGSGPNHHHRPSNNRGRGPASSSSGGAGAGAASSASRSQPRNPYAASATAGNRPPGGPGTATGSSASAPAPSGGPSAAAGASASASAPASSTAANPPPSPHPRPGSAGSAGGFTTASGAAITPRNPYASSSASASAPPSSSSSTAARMDEDEEEGGDHGPALAASAAAGPPHRRTSPSSSAVCDVGPAPLETTPMSRGFDYGDEDGGDDPPPPETTTSSSSSLISSSAAAMTSNGVDHRPRGATTTTTPTPIPTPSSSVAISSVATTSASTSAPVASAAVAARSLSAPPGGGRSPTALTVPLSFGEFRDLLLRLAVDRDLYDEYAGRVFVVPCKMLERGDRLDFNIVRRKNSGGGGGGGGKQKKVCVLVVWCIPDVRPCLGLFAGLALPFVLRAFSRASDRP